MVELTTLFATLSLFLAWRVYAVNKRLYMAELMLRGIVSGKVTITHTDAGVGFEMRKNTNG